MPDSRRCPVCGDDVWQAAPRTIHSADGMRTIAGPWRCESGEAHVAYGWQPASTASPTVAPAVRTQSAAIVVQ